MDKWDTNDFAKRYKAKNTAKNKALSRAKGNLEHKRKVKTHQVLEKH